VLDEHFTSDVATFKAANGLIRASPYRRFSYNPLLGHPLVAGLTDQHLLPVPAQVMRKISPLGIYYAGVAIADWGNKFAEDLGELFEQYVGRQLGTLTDIAIHSAITYDKATTNDLSIGSRSAMKRSSWWRSKSARQSENMRLGKPEADTDITRMLSHAYKQIATTERLISEDHPAFLAIPHGLPRLGLIVTMESFYIGQRRTHPQIAPYDAQHPRARVLERRTRAPGHPYRRQRRRLSQGIHDGRHQRGLAHPHRAGRTQTFPQRRIGPGVEHI
jgi:hypothetical protein